ncbi:oocyte zinc finger protein XlCOF15 [Zeugodacus cucurbitae]|uniref:oocyte zinc finger protein XlCOF15 n=1 Tax=Zeugodacus cucurbitae TaxID=28588 RepID=UPI0023D95494|nr:oocyte zinc finger protein XlCOF15 [Zeugodacus cucurbitae]
MLQCSEYVYEPENFISTTPLDIEIDNTIVLCEQDSGFKNAIELFDEDHTVCMDVVKSVEVHAKSTRSKGRPAKRYDFQFKCDHCDYSTAYARHFRNHMSQTHNDYHTHIFKCTQCSEAYVEERSLREHVKYLHNCVQRQPKFICANCGKGFPKQSHLTRHSYVHNPEKKPFLCDRCPMRFSNQSSLARHFEAKHIENKAHTCLDCGMAFGHIYGLKAHRLRLHQMEV